MGQLSVREAGFSNSRGACGHGPITGRSLSDVICQRLYWLDGMDRLLLELVYEKNTSQRQVAQLIGLSETTVSRRVRKLTKGLLSRDYQICLKNRWNLSAFQLKLARERFVLRLSYKAIARRHRISQYRVQYHLHRVSQVLQNAKAGPMDCCGGHSKEGGSICIFPYNNESPGQVRFPGAPRK